MKPSQVKPILFAPALFLATSSLAQPGSDESTLEPVASPAVAVLGETIYETEGDWQATWTPLNRTGTYSGIWSKGSEVQTAHLELSESHSVFTIIRTQPQSRSQPGGTCRYTGRLNAAQNIMVGSYKCDWMRLPAPWRASIGQVVPTTRNSDIPGILPANYLNHVWTEHEGSWRGRWLPQNPRSGDGRFDARWTMGNQSAAAQLTITIYPGSNQVRVNRIDPGGRHCNYYGRIATAAPQNIRGTYTCDGSHAALPWSAVVEGIGH